MKAISQTDRMVVLKLTFEQIFVEKHLVLATCRMGMPIAC
jgi:hypothetical protein